MSPLVFPLTSQVTAYILEDVTNTVTSKCRKCNGTGRHPSRVEGGRCFACQGLAVALTAATLADDEAYRAEMGFGMTLAERSAARKAKRAGRS
jgi:hypothetical protein